MKINIDQIMNDPKTLFEEMMRSDPEFVKFVNANKGKTLEQIAQDNMIDINALNKLIG